MRIFFVDILHLTRSFEFLEKLIYANSRDSYGINNSRFFRRMVMKDIRKSVSKILN